jgi:hypothetical protein
LKISPYLLGSALALVSLGCSLLDTPVPSPCAAVACSGKGQCAILNDQPTCSCNEGYVADSVNGLSCIPVGSASNDAGNSATDAGTPAADTGRPQTDAGAGTGGDAAAPSGDAGPADGGTHGDAHTPGADAGTSPDAGLTPTQACEDAHCRGDNTTEEGNGTICVDNHLAFFPSQSGTPHLANRLQRSQPIPGEAVVTDGLSQLMWTGCALGLSGGNCQNGTRNDHSSLSHREACEALSWGGFNDWVRPDGILLNSIIDHRLEHPHIATSAFPNLADFRGNGTIAFGRHKESNDYKIRMSLDDGNMSWGRGNSQSSLCVRAVDGGTVPSIIRRCLRTTFGSVAVPTTTDPSTGLQWQSCLAGSAGNDCSSGSPEPMTWQTAYDYCDALDWAGETDWRLPSMDQMFSSYAAYPDEGLQLPAAGFQVIGNNDAVVWTRTPRAFRGNTAFRGIAARRGYTSTAQGAKYVRCVRGDRWSDEITYPDRVCRTMTPVGHAGLRRGDDLQLARSESQVSGEWLVTDSYYGIQWTGCLLGQSGTNCEHGTPLTLTGTDMPTACSSLRWGDLDDWRVPSADELRSLFDYTLGEEPPLSAPVRSAIPGIENFVGYLSADGVHGNPANHSTAVLGQRGNIILYSGNRNTLCVRDHGQQRPRRVRRCLDTTAWTRSEGTVRDVDSGLEWMACKHGLNGVACSNGSMTTANHSTAQTTCDSLSWAGHEDWRLPNGNEALTIYDSSRYHSTKIDARAVPFQSLAVGQFSGWTTSSSRDQAGWYRMGAYLNTEGSENNSLAFRCVRSLGAN